MPLLPFDGLNPFMAAKIISPDGIGVPMWTQAQVTSSGGLAVFDVPHRPVLGGATALCYLRDLTIEMSLFDPTQGMGGLAKITAVLTPPYRDAVALLDSDLLQWGLSRIEVQFGYVGGTPQGPVLLSQPISALIMKPDIQLGVDCSITLNCISAGFSLTRQETTKTHNGVSRRVLIRLLARGLDARGNPTDKQRGMVVEFDDSVDEDNASSEGLGRVVSESSGGLTAWAHITKLVHESHCYMMLDGTSKDDGGKNPKLKIFSRNGTAKKPAKFLFTLFEMPSGVIAPAGGVFPVLSASSPSMFLFLPGASNGLIQWEEEREATEKIAAAEAAAKSEVEHKVAEEERKAGKKASKEKKNVTTDATSAPGRTSADGVVAYGSSPEFPGTEQSAVFFGDQINQVSNDQKKAQYDMASAAGMSVQLDIESIGVPEILPTDIVEVRGLGKRFCGDKEPARYMVFKVTHTLGSGGATTRLELRSSVTPAFPAAKGASPKNPNQSAPLKEESPQGTEVPAKPG